MTGKYTLQKKGLSRRYLFGLPDLLTSPPGIGLRLFGLLEGFGKFGRLGRILLLQSLAFADGVFQIMLHFGHPLFVLAAGNLFGL